MLLWTPVLRLVRRSDFRPLVMLQVVQLDLPDVCAGHIRMATCVQLFRGDVGRVNSVLLTRIRDQVLDFEHLVVLSALPQVRLPALLLERVRRLRTTALVLLIHVGHLSTGRTVALSRRCVSDRRCQAHGRLAIRAAAHGKEVVDLLLLRRLRGLSRVERVARELGALHLAALRVVLGLVQPAVARGWSLGTEAMADTGDSWLLNEHAIGAGRARPTHEIVRLRAAAHDSHLHLSVLDRDWLVLRMA